MARWIGKGFFTKIAVGAVSVFAAEFLFNKKTWTGVKKGFTNFKNFVKQLCTEGAEAYRKGRDGIS